MKSNRRALEGIVFADIATAQEILRMPNRLSTIDLIIETEDDLAAIQAILPDGVRLEKYGR